MSSDGVTYLPRFLGEEGERFFTLQLCCSADFKAHIVFIPPFGEEMNRCRSLVATQARSFARAGYACTLLDFYGTGESQGRLSESTLQIWEDNIRLTIDTLLAEADRPITLWGLRLGGLIALDYASKVPGSIQDIVLWHPVNSAKIYVGQVLRQRVATLMLRNLEPETTKDMRQKLDDGEDLEVAGYTLSGALVSDIEGIDVGSMTTQLCSGKIFWLEHTIEAGKEVSLPTRKALESLSQAGNTVEVSTFSDPPIWLIHERDSAPELLALSDGLLR